ncbi:toprim domain-containing protein [Mycoplasmopsis hyopharyngis]|uniref:toprim domain-containing protein n=1 Tax=Mycoplasmopsis hyopharyngis TaxID=29558 RepID=UPI0038733CBD
MPLLDELEEVQKILSSLMKISKKQAEKIIEEILVSNQNSFDTFIQTIKKTKEKYSFCNLCHGLKNEDTCNVCFDSNRDNTLLVVEHFSNIIKFEKLNFYHGKYYVLPQLINTKNLNILNLEKAYQELIKYAINFEEVILALSPTLEGEMSTIKILKLLKQNNIKSSRLAIGLPVGSNVEYLDGLTLEQAIKNRQAN